MKKYMFFFVLLVSFLSVSAQHKQTDANINGHVVSKGEHLPFVSIVLEGTTIGTTTDETGHYRLLNLAEGLYVLKVQLMGYKPVKKEVVIARGETKEVNIDLEEDLLGLEEVVVTGDRSERKRRDASVIVNTLSPKLLQTVSAVTLADGLTFSPGLRMENNCQNCGFNQVRMNGLEGPYSQILVNGRAIFSGLAGVYGLELIPASMLERVEVVRGGGSALYGSNAIAGTINLIVRDPVSNTYEFGVTGNSVGAGLRGAKPSFDYNVSGNATVVSDDRRTGMALYGFNRDHQPFDANGDGFSELALINNTTFGSRLFHRFGSRNKVSADFFSIKENRRGGDSFELPEHEAEIAEAVRHAVTTGGLTFEQYFRESDLWTVYVSGQRVHRDSYYGANRSLKDYGNTLGNTYAMGSHYVMRLNNAIVTMGVEDREEWLRDTKLGYADVWNPVLVGDSVVSIPHVGNTLVADQRSSIMGVFGQYDLDLGALDVSLGARLDRYVIGDRSSGNADKSGTVFSPRVTLKYELMPSLQARASYSQGYRAPQIFDEDLHIETSGSRQVIHENAPDLKQETSHSFLTSLDFNRQLGAVSLGLLVEAFYTRLEDAFVNDYGLPDAQGVVTYTRRNAEGGAAVKGVNLELNLVPGPSVSVKSGFTLQSSRFESAQEFGERRFMRAPDQYGFMALDWKVSKAIGLSSSANYTGRMLVPYFGPNGADTGELRRSTSFFDWGLKARYTVKLNGASLQVSGGVKNLLNAYQSDFDFGAGRDPGYMYGPGQPRTLFIGLKIGNNL